ncbi:MAG TPA: D-amino acid dehydrogenase [Candidatus Competibacteraceae bacterium]|nr:D-amino acid dehydrogenase [Candidatus Competibacteraceae bacterium]
MKVVILGSGVVGVASAYYLAKAGHEVEVLDRQPGPALETSYANAGEVSPGYASPWAGPGVPLKAVKWLLQKHAPLVVRPKLDPAMWAWMWRMLLNCTQAAYEVNKPRMMRLAHYSRDCLIELRRDTGIQYDERAKGTLQLFRDQKGVDGTAKDIAILEQYGVSYRLLDREGCIGQEPGLARVKDKIAGGLLLPNDETGDCYKFTNALAQMAEALGVKFHYGVTIDGLEAEGGRISAVRTDCGRFQAERYVLALGSYSPQLLAPVGIRIPVFPVKGYSLTVPIVDYAAAPESTILDESYKVALTRLGDRIRVGGTAELAGYDLRLRASRCETIRFVVEDLFPGGGDMSKAQFWTGLRPMTPDGTPIVGKTRYANLFLNTGHGTLGWTMACGSGRVIADLVSGRTPEIDMEGLGVERYPHAQAA